MGRISKKESFPGLPTPTRAKSYVLGGDPKGKSFLYCTEKHVIVRDVEDPKKSFAYVEHQKRPTCAKYSPTGYYICSADANGKVRIWDTTQEEHILKYEYHPISGAILDIAWDGESKRIAVCGEGKQNFASAFLWDSGSSVGTLDKMEKHCNSVSIKPNRPYRCAVASEDYSAYFYQGPPFKLLKTCGEGTNFCNCVRFAPDGSVMASANSDGNVYLYDGKTAELIGKLGDGKAHKGGVYSLDFSPDSKELVTASGDKSLKVWNVEKRSLIEELQIGTTIDDQQLSCLWQGNNIFGVSLCGDIKIFDREDLSKPPRVLTGHKKNITAVAVGQNATIYTASFDAVMVGWNSATGEAVKFTGDGHKNSIVSMVHDSANDQLITISIDDTLRFTPSNGSVFTPESSIALDSQPSSLSLAPESGYILVACEESLTLIKGDKKLDSHAWKKDAFPVSASVSNQGHVAATGVKSAFAGVEKHEVHLLEVVDDKLVPNTNVPMLEGFQHVARVTYSPDGNRLAVANLKEIHVYEVANNYQEPKKMTGASTRITGMVWAPDNRHLATFSIDSSIHIWDAVDGKHTAQISNAHPKANVADIAWLSEDVLVSVGSDCAVTQWQVTF